VFSEGQGDAHLQLDPAFRRVEEEMLAWAEEHLAAGGSTGTGRTARRLRTFVYDNDPPRRELLQRRGYAESSSRGVIRRSCFDGRSRPRPDLAPDHRIRATRPGDEEDARRIAVLLNAAFGRDFHTAAEYLVFTSHAPSFRSDLDLVAEAPDGTFAAYAGLPYDDVNRRGIFEPVCAHPEHRRKGLARDLMLEGMRRLEAIGAADITVETGDAAAANRLYDALGFHERVSGAVWTRNWS
jgi:ribosomal protein S18 acetylase RimI-like enzyme